MWMDHVAARLCFLLAAVFVGRFTVNSFVVVTRRSKLVQPIVPYSRYKSRLFLQKSEAALRKVIADRNVNKVNEDRYIVLDGETLEQAEPATSINASDLVLDHITTNGSQQQQDQEEISLLLSNLEKISSPRAYPIFVAEKAAEFAESTWTGLVQMLAPSKAGTGAATSTTNGNDKTDKERVVILGTGWGAASLVKDIDTSLFDVTVISPRNYFVFTPMLAGASVGTVEVRSITEPIRKINRHVQFLEATATNIHPERQTVACESVVCGSNSLCCEIEEFTVDYDRLVVTVGAQTNTFGIPGVREHCNFLKQVEDARRIRTALVNCLERANLPGLSDDEKRNDLTFVVIGAGPTGIEFAAELRDFIEQDGPRYYPELLRFVRIKVIEASSTVLAPFDKSLQQEAIHRLKDAPRIRDPATLALFPERFELTELLLESSVKEVTEKKIVLGDGQEIPYGMAVWAAGNGPLPITLQMIEALGQEQTNLQPTARGRIATDPWLRALGGKGKILALGDCSYMVKGALPATGQVAAQQGEYLARIMNHKFDLSPPLFKGIFLPPVKNPAITKTFLSDSIAGLATKNSKFAKPFQFLNLGILAYTGGFTALAQMTPVPNAPIKSSGKVGNLLWRSVYLNKQVSWRNRFLVLNDWVRRTWFGRDITRL
ncbi:hypothetical protein ACA910_001395 [Epithemia clementina (nom. ined.)]